MVQQHYFRHYCRSFCSPDDKALFMQCSRLTQVDFDQLTQGAQVLEADSHGADLPLDLRVRAGPPAASLGRGALAAAVRCTAACLDHVIEDEVRQHHQRVLPHALVAVAEPARPAAPH